MNNNQYRIEMTITKDGEDCLRGSTYIIPSTIHDNGECESVDAEVGRLMRQLRKAYKMSLVTYEEIDTNDEVTNGSDALEHRAEERLFRERQSNIKY